MRTTYKKSIIIPAYNEEDRIERVLLRYAEYFSAQEIVVVCDGCTDNTPHIVRLVQDKFPNIKLLLFEQKLGKGGGLKKGFKIAEGGLIGFVDADDSILPEEMNKMFDLLGNYDVVIGSRRHEHSRILIKQSFPRRIASKVFNIFVSFLFGLSINDTQCGVKVFRKNALQSVLSSLKTNGFEFDVELLWRLNKNGYQIKEFPVTWKHSDGSTFSLSNAPRMLLALIKVKFNKKRGIY